MARGDGRRALLLAAGLNATASAQEPGAAGKPRSPGAPVAAVHAGTQPADRSGWVSVWVDLDLPELASVPREQTAVREALRLKIHAQQQAVMAQLADLGAVEQARVQQVRNALAVRLPGAQLQAARRIQGVRAVRPVRHIDRGPLVQGD